MSGYSNQPFGSTSYGIGPPALTDGHTGTILRDPETGRTEGSRYINPTTRDFEIDEHRRFRGHMNVRHLVQMAIQTAKSSSAMRELGFDTSDLEVITSDTERRIARALDEAVAHLVAQNLIVSLGVTRFRAGPADGLPPGRTYTRFNWRDVATGEVFGEPILMAEVVVKDATTCRDDMCRTMRNGLIERGVVDPNVGPGSEQYVLFTAVGNELAVIGANNIIKGDAQMPDTAQGADMERIADIFKRKKQPAAGSVGAVIIRCSATTSVPTGKELVDAAGLLYEVTVGGDYSDGQRVPIQAKSVGAATNHAEGDTLQWQGAPPYTDPKALVASGGLVNGADAEGTEDLRAAVYSILQNAPGTGNWEHCAEIAEKSDPRVQKAFVYPAALGPSTIRIAVVAVPTLTSKERDVDTTIVTSIVEPSVLGQLIGHKSHIGVTTVTNVDADVGFALSLPEAPTANPPGPGGGWKNGTPWPRPNGSTTFRCTVTAVTSSTQFTVDAEGPPTAGVSRIAWLSPFDWRLYTALVTTSSGSSGAYVITLDKPLTGITVGSYIWPDSVNAKLYCETVLAQFALMGPGELSSNPSVLVRGFRHPIASNGWPSDLGAHLPNVLTKGHAEVLQAQFLHRAASGHASVTGAAGQFIPNVPVSAASPPLQFIPRHIAFYRIG